MIICLFNLSDLPFTWRTQSSCDVVRVGQCTALSFNWYEKHHIYCGAKSKQFRDWRPHVVWSAKECGRSHITATKSCMFIYSIYDQRFFLFSSVCIPIDRLVITSIRMSNRDESECGMFCWRNNGRYPTRRRRRVVFSSIAWLSTPWAYKICAEIVLAKGSVLQTVAWLASVRLPMPMIHDVASQFRHSPAQYTRKQMFYACFHSWNATIFWAITAPATWIYVTTTSLMLYRFACRLLLHSQNCEVSDRANIGVFGSVFCNAQSQWAQVTTKRCQPRQ